MKKSILLTTFISLILVFSANAYEIDGIYGYGNFSNINSATYGNSLIINPASLMRKNTGLFLSFGMNISSTTEKRTVKLFDSYDNYIADYPIYESTTPYYTIQNIQVSYRHKFFGVGLFYTPFTDNNYNYDYIEHDNYYVKTGELRKYASDNTNRLGFALGISPLKWLSLSASYQDIQGYVNEKYQHLFVDPTVLDTTIVDRNTYSGNIWNTGLRIIPNNFIDLSIFGKFPANVTIQDDRSIDTVTTTSVNTIKYPLVIGGELKISLPDRLPATITIDGNYSFWHNMQITDQTIGDSVYYDSTLNNAIFLKMIVKHKLSMNQTISFGVSVQQSYVINDLLIPAYILGYSYNSNNGFEIAGTIKYSNYLFSNNDVNVVMPLSTTFNFSNLDINISVSKSFDF